jgi:hypothetical protein
MLAHLAVVVEGTPIVPGQENPYAGGLYSLSEDEDDSPPLLDLPAVLEASTAAALMAGMTAAAAPEDLDTVLDVVLESENRRNRVFDANMTALRGRNLQVELTLSDVCGDIALIHEDTNRITSKSIALVELNKSTCLAVESNASAFLQAMEANAATFWLYVEKANKTLTTIAGNHTQAMTNMQGKLKSSFNRMKYLEKTFASIPERVTNHLDATLLAILTKVVGKALTPSLTTMVTESLPPTMASVLEGSFTDFQSRFDSAISAGTTQQVQELLETATDSCISKHTAVMVAIEDIGMRISALDKIITLADASPMCPSLADVRFPTVDASAPGPSPVVQCPSPRPPSLSPPTEPCTNGSSRMPVPPTWGHGFHPFAPEPLLSTFWDPGLRVDMAPTNILGGKIKTPQSIDPVRHARNKKMNRFDSAGLTNSGYHIGDFGVDSLTEVIISKCGYQSFHVDHPEDVLLCFQEIVNIHRVVVQTWTNARIHFSRPVMEYILEKAFPVFPCLQGLYVADTVKFYDGLQKILMWYLLPLMPFDSIRLPFGFEGLCPPGLGTVCYSAIASAWMDVLPRLLPVKESEVELTVFAVSIKSNNGFDLLWRIFGDHSAGIQVHESGSSPYVDT